MDCKHINIINKTIGNQVTEFCDDCYTILSYEKSKSNEQKSTKKINTVKKENKVYAVSEVIEDEFNEFLYAESYPETITKNQIIHGDCRTISALIPSNSVNLIITDLPYGTTAAKWDVLIPFEHIWAIYDRILKEDGVVLLFGDQPFMTDVIESNRKDFRYCWYWIKNKKTGFFNANKMPMKCVEEIAVFYKKLPTFNKQIELFKSKIQKNKHRKTGLYGDVKEEETIITHEAEIDTLFFDKDEEKVHETQKPLSLLKYLINVYSNEGDFVVDTTAGSCGIAKACIDTGRDYICIEKDDKNYANAVKSLKKHISAPKMEMKFEDEKPKYTQLTID